MSKIAEETDNLIKNNKFEFEESNDPNISDRKSNTKNEEFLLVDYTIKEKLDLEPQLQDNINSPLNLNDLNKNNVEIKDFQSNQQISNIKNDNENCIIMKDNQNNRDISDADNNMYDIKNNKLNNLYDNVIVPPNAELLKEFEKLAEKERLKPKKHQYYPLLHFFAFLITIIILYFSLIFHSKFTTIDFSYFLNIYENWKLAPLENIYIGSKEECNFKDKNILNDYWPGLNEGCECEGIIYKGKCPKNKANCIPLKKFEKEKLNIWQGFNLCGIRKSPNNNLYSIKNIDNKNLNFNKDKTTKNNDRYNRILNNFEKSNKKDEERFFNINYFNLDIYNSSLDTFDKCPDNFKNCGIIDSYSNYLCIPYEEICPINNINTNNYFFKNSFYSNENNNVKINDLQLYKEKNTTENNVKIASIIDPNKTIENNFKLKNSEFEFSNNFNPLKSKIPIEFATSFDLPCKNPYYKNANFYVFYLDPNYGKQKCFEYAEDINPQMNLFTFNNKNYKKKFYFENNFNLIDKYSYRDLLIDNKIYQKFNRIPLSYIDQLNQNIGLYSRNYFGINAKCHREIKEKNLVENIYFAFEDLKNIFTIIPYLMGIILLSVFNLFFFIYFFIGSMNLSTKKLKNIKNDQYIAVKSFLSLLFVMVLSLLAIFILSVTNTVFLFSISNLDIIFKNSECVDIFSYDFYRRYFSVVDSGKILMMVSLLLSLLLFVIYISYTVSFMNSHIVNDSKEDSEEEENTNRLENSKYLNLNE